MTTTRQLIDALHEDARVIDLAHSLFRGMAQSSRHPRFDLVVPRRHGDSVRSDGSSGANDMIITGSHVGTHIDALSHISQDMTLHGQVDALAAQRTGVFSELGAEHIPPMLRQGILLDIPAILGAQRCAAGHAVTVDELTRALALSGAQPRPGCVFLMRTGWSQLWDDPVAFEGVGTGSPGLDSTGAEWIAAFQPAAVGIDTITCDAVPAGHDANHFLPAHRVLLVEHGIHIIETLELEALAASEEREFLFVSAPLKLIGATGSPIRPLAVVLD